MAKEPLQYIRVSDFTMGIVSSMRRASGRFVPSMNPGAASEENTYRCVGLPTGGLGPLPRRDYAFSMPVVDPSVLYGSTIFNITGLFMAGPLVTGAGSHRNHELFFSMEFIDGTDRHYGIIRLPLFDEPMTPQSIISNTNQILPTLNQYVSTKFGSTISNSTDPVGNPGVPVVVIGWYAPGPQSPLRLWSWPDDTTPSSDSIYQISNQYAPSVVIPHQNRVVFNHQLNFAHGSIGAWPNNSYIYYTDPNNVQSISNTDPMQVAVENPANYGTGASLSANQLLLIKEANGGVMLQGDITNPLVTQLPNMYAADKVKGTASRIGFVYAGASGEAVAWSGSDSSSSISSQLDNFFYVPDDNPNVLLDERFIWCNWGNDYIVTSNLYLYDIEGRGWWRLDDPGDLERGIYAVQSATRRHLYGATFGFDDNNQDFIYGWDADKLATDWSWQGHPIRPFEGRREFEIRQLLICGQGNGSITWTPINMDGSYGPTETATFNADTPVVQRFNIATHQQFLHYRIEAYGVGDGEAPVLQWIEVGIDPRNNIPVNMSSGGGSE